MGQCASCLCRRNTAGSASADTPLAWLMELQEFFDWDYTLRALVGQRRTPGYSSDDTSLSLSSAPAYGAITAPGSCSSMASTDDHDQGGGYGGQQLAAASGREHQLYLELINNFESDNIHAYIQTNLEDSDQTRLITADGIPYEPVAGGKLFSTPNPRSANCGIRRLTTLLFDFLTICSDLSPERCLAVLFGRAPFCSTKEHACARILAPHRSVRRAVPFDNLLRSLKSWALGCFIRLSNLLLYEIPCVCDHLDPQQGKTILPASIEGYDTHPYGSSRKRRRLMEDPQVQADNLHQLWADELLDYFCLQGEYAG